MASAVIGPDDTIVGSASDGGEGVAVAATVTPGTLLHQGTAGSPPWDVVTICAVNNDTVTRTLSIEFGEANLAGTRIDKLMRPQVGPELVVDRFRLKRGKPVRAFCATASVINCFTQIEQL